MSTHPPHATTPPPAPNPLPTEVASARHLTVRYGTHAAVTDVDLHLGQGEVLGLIGPDGAGKTSILRVIAGLQRAAAGQVHVFGMPVWTSRRALLERVGYLPQRFALYGDLTVDENIRFFARLRGVRDWRARKEALLARVQLAPFADRPADQLSGGMKQKLALACSLMHAPELLILDEPTTGVDPVSRREFWRLLADLVAEGLTLLVATPYLDEAERCSRVLLVHAGRVLAAGTPAQLRALAPGTVLRVTGSPRTLLAATAPALPGVLDAQPFGAAVHIRFDPAATDPSTLVAALITAGVAVAEARPAPPSLEDAFLSLLRQAGIPRGEAA